MLRSAALNVLAGGAAAPDPTAAAPHCLAQDGVGGGDGAHRAEQELLGGVPLMAVEVEAVGPEEALSPAGSVQAVLEGIIVVKVR